MKKAEPAGSSMETNPSFALPWWKRMYLASHAVPASTVQPNASIAAALQWADASNHSCCGSYVMPAQSCCAITWTAASYKVAVFTAGLPVPPSAQKPDR